MSGSVSGGKKAAETNRAQDPDFYKRIGKIGGKKSRGGGFATNPELAKEAGRKGGTISRGGGRRKGERY